jgi:hypothetical protein
MSELTPQEPKKIATGGYRPELYTPTKETRGYTPTAGEGGALPVKLPKGGTGATKGDKGEKSKDK